MFWCRSRPDRRARAKRAHKRGHPYRHLNAPARVFTKLQRTSATAASQNKVGIMAKALFSKGQRVFVKPVGTWSAVEKVTPQWVKGVEEPLKVFYDVGLGRD